MPKRNRHIRKDSSQSFRSLSPNDIPWFCNFGKFSSNEDFFLRASANSAQPTRCPEKKFFNTNDSHDAGHVYFDEANANLITSFDEKDKGTDRLLRASRGPRIVSELPISMSRNVDLSLDQSSKKVLRSRQIDRTDGLAPSSLSSMLRRMVSFDNHEKGPSGGTLDGHIEYSRLCNVSKDQEVDPDIIDYGMNSFEDEYPSSLNPYRSKGMASHTRKSPAQDSGSHNHIDHDVHSNGKRRRHWRQTSKLGGPPSKNLGAVIRRMISFEKTS